MSKERTHRRSKSKFHACLAEHIHPPVSQSVKVIQTVVNIDLEVVALNLFGLPADPENPDMKARRSSCFVGYSLCHRQTKRKN